MDIQRKIEDLSPVINAIGNDAHALHASVNHAYDRIRPYGFHLDMVVNWVRKYIEDVCENEQDVLPIFFAAYYHDSIEDARLTYNDVMKVAREVMDEEQAYLATYTYDTYGNIRSIWVRDSETYSAVLETYEFSYADDRDWKDQPLHEYGYFRYRGQGR